VNDYPDLEYSLLYCQLYDFNVYALTEKAVVDNCYYDYRLTVMLNDDANG